MHDEARYSGTNKMLPVVMDGTPHVWASRNLTWKTKHRPGWNTWCTWHAQLLSRP